MDITLLKVPVCASLLSVSFSAAPSTFIVTAKCMSGTLHITRMDITVTNIATQVPYILASTVSLPYWKAKALSSILAKGRPFVQVNLCHSGLTYMLSPSEPAIAGRPNAAALSNGDDYPLLNLF